MDDDLARALVEASLYVALADRDVTAEERRVVVDRLRQVSAPIPQGHCERLVGQTLVAIAVSGREAFLDALADRLDRATARSALAIALETAATQDGLGAAESERVRELARAFAIDDSELASLQRELAQRTDRDPTTLRPRTFRS
jgi:hypothetical protein